MVEVALALAPIFAGALVEAWPVKSRHVNARIH